MLANVLHVRRLRQKFVHLVAHVELLVLPEVAAGQLLLDSRKHLQGAGVLQFPRFVGNALLGIEDAALQNRRPAVASVIAGLHSILPVDIGGHGLPTFTGER